MLDYPTTSRPWRTVITVRMNASAARMRKQPVGSGSFRRALVDSVEVAIESVEGEDGESEEGGVEDGDFGGPDGDGADEGDGGHEVGEAFGTVGVVG